MTFAAVSDLTTRYGDQELKLLADRDGDGQLDAGVAEGALADADAEIISELAGAVSIDTQNPPRTLIRIACQIARYRLYGANPPEAARTEYKDALEFLRRVQAGKASLDGGAADPIATPAPSYAAASETRDRIFRRGV